MSVLNRLRRNLIEIVPGKYGILLEKYEKSDDDLMCTQIYNVIDDIMDDISILKAENKRFSQDNLQLKLLRDQLQDLVNKLQLSATYGEFKDLLEKASLYGCYTPLVGKQSGFKNMSLKFYLEWNYYFKDVIAGKKDCKPPYNIEN